jgi:hypothetical protein
MKPNPAPTWVNRILNSYWDQLLAAAPTRSRKVMPVIDKQTQRGKMTFEELGCGHYGCVIKSTEDGIVFKLTSDASEAAFVAAACKLGHFPYGIVRYYNIVEIPETYRGRRVFALWREEAGLIGFPLQTMERGAVTSDYIRSAWKELLKHLEEFKKQANIVRSYVTKAKDKERALTLIANEKDFSWQFSRGDSAYALRGAQRAAVALQLCQDIAEIMEHTYASDQIGGALAYYLDNGILLADVHANNVGVATRAPNDDYDDWHGVNVITDPGHMVPLQDRWLAVRIKAI